MTGSCYMTPASHWGMDRAEGRWPAGLIMTVLMYTPVQHMRYTGEYEFKVLSQKPLRVESGIPTR